ncbi:hypothetical protein GCM10023085_42160 [Actinomadura viridis]|uniref:Uncharacterized protein n=1 Tax=Actinomadura viridis TaxID=58110 RepID=A0A931GTX0_9ACTN|nr:hypothetical protein [Actinomadura viridis]MBG6092509.1 hypothetical protein [Actinomadura viridis]
MAVPPDGPVGHQPYGDIAGGASGRAYPQAVGGRLRAAFEQGERGRQPDVGVVVVAERQRDGQGDKGRAQRGGAEAAESAGAGTAPHAGGGSGPRGHAFPLLAGR